MKNIINEMKEVEWLNGRKLMIDTGWVMLFTGILLVYFTVVDKLISDAIQNFFL